MRICTRGMQNHRRKGWRRAATSALMATTVLAGAAASHGAEITMLWNDDFQARTGRAISNDGTFYIAGAHYVTPQGVVEISGSNGVATVLRQLSADGLTVVGSYVFDQAGVRAFRWRADGGMDNLGVLVDESGYESEAHGVSGDGRRVVGVSDYDSGFAARAGFVWIEGATGGVQGNEQMFVLIAEETESTEARAISDNGNFVAGAFYIYDDVVRGQAMRWDITDIEENGANVGTNLGTLGGSSSWSTAISGDGSRVVGTAQNEDEYMRAFLWRDASGGNNAGMIDLGTLGGSHSNAMGISANGEYVVGRAETGDLGSHVAFRWTEEEGMRAVSDLLAEDGVDVGSWILRVANDVSENGRVIIGTMAVGDEEDRAFIARLDGDGPNGGGLMDVAEYHQTLYSAAGIANAGEFLTWLPMNGAHHRPLMLTPSLSGDMCAWATGDFAQHGPSSTGMALAEVGACTDLAGGNVRIGGAVGTSGSWQDLALGGSARMQGQYVLSEIDWQPDGTPLLLSVTGMLGSYKANIDRAYSNGAATAMSRGETDAFGGAIRVRADWLEAAVLGNTSINPYASVGFSGLHVDGYTERGGPFPAVFNEQILRHADIRVGLTAVTEFSASTKLSTTLEVAHRTGTAAGASGNVPGLFNFSLGGGTYSQTWARAGLELDHKVTDNLSLSASTHLATSGRDPSIAMSVGLKGGF